MECKIIETTQIMLGGHKIEVSIVEVEISMSGIFPLCKPLLRQRVYAKFIDSSHCRTRRNYEKRRKYIEMGKALELMEIDKKSANIQEVKREKG
jgi:hypothetical protein